MTASSATATRTGSPPIVVPATGRTRHGDVPAEGFDPVGQPAQAGAAAPACPTDAVVRYLELQRSALARAVSRTSRACECFAAFARASLATKYAAASTGSGSRPAISMSTRTGAPRADKSSSAAARPRSTRIAGRMPWLSSRSSSSAASARRAPRAARPPGAPIARELGLGQAERHRDRHEPLLRPVVEIALDPPPLGLGGLHQARPRRLQLGEAREQVGAQTLVLECEACGGADGFDQLGVVAQRGIVNQRRNRFPARSTIVETRSAPWAGNSMGEPSALD